jgi:hypothetical protein
MSRLPDRRETESGGRCPRRYGFGILSVALIIALPLAT